MYKADMSIEIRKMTEHELGEGIEIWNSVVMDGMAFPQLEILDRDSGKKFFEEQTYTGVAVDVSADEVVGVYILHPNNVGRCGHICNASYAVKQGKRGLHIGENLVLDCMKQAKECGFQILQFNAVVKSNTAALGLYQKLGFVQLGIIPNGFLTKNGEYEDIIPHYIAL